ncbi:MAG: aminotransferase class V-fold PLP-dependent enzyme [Oligoflexia bacterium]|nr:aminotransferase class V-fold PLP-dependent enzyme [Oligoflexia bacterium]
MSSGASPEPTAQPSPGPSSQHVDLQARAAAQAKDDPTSAVRELACVPAGRIRLESHTLGPTLRPVLDAPIQVLEEWREHGVRSWLASWSGGAANWMAIQPEQILESLGAVIGAAPEHVVVRGTLTENLALALRMLGRPREDGAPRPKILTHELLFPSDADAIDAEHDFYRRDITTSTIRVTPSLPRGIFATDDFLAALERHQGEAGILLFEHQPYLSGQVLDMSTICHFARERGYFVIVDAAHSGGVYPLDADASGAHIIIGCGYKEFLTGPGALGWMYANMQDLRDIGAWFPRGWWGRSPESRFTFGGKHEFDRGALSLQLSTPSPVLQSMWAAVLKCYRDAGGIQVVHQQAIERGDLFLDRLAQHPSFGTRFGVLSQRDLRQRSAEIVLYFASAQESARLFAWLGKPDDGGTAVDADTRTAYYDQREGLMRFGFHPFIVSHAQALEAADRICVGLNHI